MFALFNKKCTNFGTGLKFNRLSVQSLFVERKFYHSKEPFTCAILQCKFEPATEVAFVFGVEASSYIVQKCATKLKV